eukprot:scaffold4274_cov267-Pinguiococcus_pyrenoidosus.AAC.3
MLLPRPRGLRPGGLHICLRLGQLVALLRPGALYAALHLIALIVHALAQLLQAPFDAPVPPKDRVVGLLVVALSRQVADELDDLRCGLGDRLLLHLERPRRLLLLPHLRADLVRELFLHVAIGSDLANHQQK